MQEVGIKFKIQSEGQQQLAAIKQAVSGVSSEVKIADGSLKSLDSTSGNLIDHIAEMRKQFSAARESIKGVGDEAKKTGANVSVASADFEKATASSAGLKGGFVDLAASALGVNSTMLAAVAVIGTVATVAISAAKAGYELVDSQSAIAEQTSNLAVRLNLTIGQTERLQAMARIAGVGINVMESSAVQLGSALEDTGHKGDKIRKTLQGIGIDTATAAGGEREYGAVLLEVLGHLATVEDSTKRVSLAKELLGRNAAKQLAPMIADYGELNRAVRALGVGFDDNVVKTLAKANDEIDKAGIAWDEFKKKLAAKIAPIYIPIIRVVTSAISAKSNQEQVIPDAIALARASEASRLLDPDVIGIGDSRNDPLLDARAKAQGLIQQDFAAGRVRSEAFRARRSNTEDGLKDRLRDVDAQRDKLRGELLTGLGGTLSAGSAGLLEGQISTLDKEAASIQSRLDSIKKTAKDYERQIAEVKKLEVELARLRGEAELKPFGGIGQIELRRRNKIDEINRELPAGPKRASLIADFNRSFGEELAAEARKISDQQQQLLQTFEKIAFRGDLKARDITRLTFGDGSSLKDFKRQFEADAKIRELETAGQRSEIVDQSNRTARFTELRLGPGHEVDAARQAIGIRKQLIADLYVFEVAQAKMIEDVEDRRVAMAKADAAFKKETRDAELDGQLKLLELQKQRSEKYREDAGRVFDSLTAKGGGGLRELLGGVVKQQERAIFQNISQGLFEKAGGVLGKIGQASGLGGLLKGTLFDPQNAATPEIRSRDKNTKAVENLTAAVTGGGLLSQLTGGGTFAGGLSASDLLGSLGSGSTPPFVGDSSPSGGGLGGFLGRLFGGKSAGTNNSPNGFVAGLGSVFSKDGLGLFGGLKGGQFGGSTTERAGNIVGSAALVGAGAYGIQSGIRQGGASGALTAIQGGLSIAAAVPGPQQPFIQVAALVAGLVKGLLPDPRAAREDEMRDEIQKRKYTGPTAIDRTEDRDGNALGYDANGNLRKAGGNGGVTININAIDAKSFMDRSGEFAAAITKELRTGNDQLRVGIQRSVFGVA